MSVDRHTARHQGRRLFVRAAAATWLTLAATAAVVTPATVAADTNDVVTGTVFTHTVVRGETLRTISSRYGVDPKTILSENDLPAVETLKVGAVLQIDNRHIVPSFEDNQVIVVNIPQRMLFAIDGAGVRGVPIAVGRQNWQTPVGAFTVVDKRADPTWHVPASILEEARRAGMAQTPVVPPGPANPLGKFWLGLSLPGIGLHGTNASDSIYRVTTHGCIRLHAADVAWLFEQTQLGAVGEVIYQPILLAVLADDVLLEAHADPYRRMGDPNQVLRALVLEAGVSDRIDWDRAGAVLAAQSGVARSIAR